MHCPVLTTASLLALASTTLASTATVWNRCSEEIFLTVTSPTTSTFTATLAAKGGIFSQSLAQSGVSIGVSKNADFYSSSTPKLNFGYTDSNGIVYYALGLVDGTPFPNEHFILNGTTSACAAETTADGSTSACADSNNLKLTLCPYANL